MSENASGQLTASRSTNTTSRERNDWKKQKFHFSVAAQPAPCPEQVLLLLPCTQGCRQCPRARFVIELC